MVSSKLSVVWLLVFITGQSLFAQAPLIKGASCKIKATGTGLTTGHIANLSVTNNGSEKIVQDLPPLFIPSAGQYQPYIVPSLTPIEVLPNTTKEFQLFGYCVDIQMPPVPAGNTIDVKLIVPLSKEGLKQEPPVVYLDPAVNSTRTTPMYIDKDPLEAGLILLKALQQISSTFDDLKNKGQITTPFSGNPEKEREAVIQQTFWIYGAALQGKVYTKDEFKQNTIKQYDSNMTVPYDKITNEEKIKVDKGVTDFWNTFEAVGVEAKVLKVAPN